jgi:uncharacterized membrane protein
MKLLRLWRRIDWRLIIVFVLVAAIVHLIVTFMAVNDQRGSAYVRLSKLLPSNKMTIVDPIAPDKQPLPFLAPEARFAFCPFDTAGAPIRVRAVLPDLGWTIGVYTADGTSAYVATASADRETTIELLIVPADDRFLGLSPQSLGKPVDEAQLTISAPKGIVVVRAPDKGKPYRHEIEAGLQRAVCAPGRA